MTNNFLFLLGLIIAPAVAEPVRLCPGQAVAPAVDARLLGHLPYEEAKAEELTAAPIGFAIGTPCRLRHEMIADLEKLIAAADAVPEVKGRIRALSCHRSIARQRQVFCGGIGPKRRSRDAADRARWVGPPGYSEHATGFAIDFGTRPTPRCPDLDPCFAQTPAGRWLLSHAAEHGFELSFPPGNGQGVSYEPWHWRWVGTSPAAPGAAAARALFLRARATFPAQPGVSDNPARLLNPAPGFQLAR